MSFELDTAKNDRIYAHFFLRFFPYLDINTGKNGEGILMYGISVYTVFAYILNIVYRRIYGDFVYHRICVYAAVVYFRIRMKILEKTEEVY